MLNVNEVVNFFDFICNKTQNGSVSPSQRNILAQRANIELFVERYGKPEEYLPGNPKPRIGWQQTKKITDDMLPFLKRAVLKVDSNGRFIRPNGTTVKDLDTGEILPEYYHASSIVYRYNTSNTEYLDVPVDELMDAQVATVLSSSVVAPSPRFPKCVFYDSFVQIYPKTLHSVVFTYLRKPATPVWGYTLVNNRPVYDPSTSTDFDWPEELFNDIVMRMCSFAGINLRQADLIQYSEQQKALGT